MIVVALGMNIGVTVWKNWISEYFSGIRLQSHYIFRGISFKMAGMDYVSFHPGIIILFLVWIIVKDELTVAVVLADSCIERVMTLTASSSVPPSYFQ